MAKSSAERAQAFKDRQRTLDRVRHDYWATTGEHEELKKCLKSLREDIKNKINP